MPTDSKRNVRDGGRRFELHSVRWGTHGRIRPLSEVAAVAKELADLGELEAVLVFDDRSGRLVDLDLRGSVADVRARYPLRDEGVTSQAGQPEGLRRGRGRPRLGVESHEVTLLPRHWAWLKAQRGGASATLRRLVDQARREGAETEAVRLGQDGTYRFLTAMLGNHPGYEEAIRALYARDARGFCAEAERWPPDLRDHAYRMAARAFQAL